MDDPSALRVPILLTADAWARVCGCLTATAAQLRAQPTQAAKWTALDLTALAGAIADQVKDQLLE